MAVGVLNPLCWCLAIAQAITQHTTKASLSCCIFQTHRFAAAHCKDKLKFLYLETFTIFAKTGFIAIFPNKIFRRSWQIYCQS
jgi:hypothetical protein